MKTKNRLTTFILKNRWYLIAVLWGIGLALGYAGFTAYALQQAAESSWLDRLYLTVQLIFLESGAVSNPPLTLNIARFLLPFLTAQTSLMALTGIFRHEIRQRTLRFARKHILVCGDGDLALFAVRAVLKSGRRTALITKDLPEADILAVEESGCVVIKGDLSDPEILTQSALSKAGYLLSFYEDDSKNIENALLADRTAAERKKGALQSITHLHDPLLSSLFLEQMLKAEWKSSIQQDVINIYEQAARLVMAKYPAFPTGSAEGAVSILIIGLGKFGQHILLETARALAAAAGGLRLDIHVLDKEANWKCAALHSRYPQLMRVCCITAHEMDIYSAEFQDTARFFEETCPGVQRVYICLNDDLQAINTALSIYRQMKETSPEIILRLSQANGVKDLFNYTQKIEMIKVVPIFDTIGDPDVLLNSTVEQLAQAFHARYIQERQAGGAGGQEVCAWNVLSEEKKESNRSLARYLKQHLGQLNYQFIPQQGLGMTVFSFSGEEVDFLARKEHERWVAERSAKGWRYGPSNDPHKKNNPNMQDWETLTDEEKSFNRAFMQAVPELVAGVRLQITRRQ